jgi:SAM-dependent methyltransferase
MDITYINPDRWEEICLADEARNSFVIPLIRSYISNGSPNYIVDVGCGTGYISRSILEAGAGQSSRWLLLDHNLYLLNYARKKLADWDNVDFLELDIRSLSNDCSSRRNDFAFICYSLLEISGLDMFMKGLNNLLNHTAQVILIYPDVIEDIETASINSRNTITQYRKGLCIIDKLNRFTDQRQEYFAHRIEDIIQSFCGLNFVLSDMRSYLTQNQKRHFALIFKRG